MPPTEYGPISLERMSGAMERVVQRLLRATSALERAGIPYAVAGGNAVAAWVSRIDPRATRGTQDVDILVRREDFERVNAVLSSAGFQHQKVLDVDAFIDGETGRVVDAVHILFAGEKVKPSYCLPAPNVDESERDQQFQVILLEKLVQMKLTSYRRKDQVHILDLIAVGLVDASWVNRFRPELAERLQHLIDTPEE